MGSSIYSATTTRIMAARTNYGCGITFDILDAPQNVQGTISSSTIRGGSDGIMMNDASYNTIAWNVLYNNGSHGIELDGIDNAVSNVVAGSDEAGIDAYGNDIVLGNMVAFDGIPQNYPGINVDGGDNTVIGNTVYGSGDEGISCRRNTNNLIVSNLVFGNQRSGGITPAASVSIPTITPSITITPTATRYIDFVRGQRRVGTGNVWVACGIGYSSTSVLDARCDGGCWRCPSALIV